MAMMISKFHKLIQSKTVWYIVLGVIIIAFVGFFTPTMNSSKSAPKATSVGELFGKKVKADELRAASRNTYLWMILSSGQMPEIDANTSAQIEQQAWVRMAALRKADKEGVIASDQEVIDQIQQMPLFQNQNRQFDPNVYKMILAQLKISSVAAEQLFREQIIVFKLMSRPTQAALISQEELIDAYKIYTDRFVLDYALLPQAEIAKTVTVTEEEAKTVFEANREAFRMPAKVMVEYVEVPVAQFVAQAEVPEGAALQVYNQNLQRFQIPAATNGAPVEYKAFEDVEEEINAEVRLEIARGLASEEATSLVVAVSPKGEGEKVEFFKTAIDAGFTVKTLPAFGPTDPINGIDETAPFRRVALNLQDDIYSSFSDAVVGQEFVYVISLKKRYESFLPEFDLVKERATEAATAQAVRQAVSDRAEELQINLAAALEAGTSFADAAAAEKLTVQTTAEFDLSKQLENDYAETLVPLCLQKQEGELCNVVPVADGVLVSFVKTRTTTPVEEGLPAVREELIRSLEQNRAQQLAFDWQSSLLKEANFSRN